MSTILDKDEQTLRGDTAKYADTAKTAHIVLGKDEKITREDVFTTSLVLFWLKVNKANFILTNKRITGYTPNTIGGYVPFGKKEVAQPLKTISSVSSSTKLHLGRLGVGLLIIILALGSVSDAFLGALFWGAIGLIILLGSYTATFDITNTAGQKLRYELSFLEKSKVESFVTEVNTMIADSA